MDATNASTGPDRAAPGVSAAHSHEGRSAIERQYAAPGPDTPKRVHVLGLGNIGKLVAHSLRGIPDPPPVTLIFHRFTWLERWQKSKREITMRDNEVEVARSGFDVEVLPENFRAHGIEKQTVGDPFEFGGVSPHEAAEALTQNAKARAEVGEESAFDPHSPQVARSGITPRSGSFGLSAEPIHNLVITTKAALTVPALLAVRHRITPQTTICFLQNGMGILDEVDEKVFPDAAQRPNYVVGVNTHGVNTPRDVAAYNLFYAVHAGHGTIALGLVPRDGHQASAFDTDDTTRFTTAQDNTCPPSARYLLRTLTRTPVLAAVGFTHTELLQVQLEKLAVNSVINPLTALLDARNGKLLYNFALTRTMRLMLAETSHIIRSLPELQAIPNLALRFGADRLETLVVKLAAKSAENISSMLADVRAGRKTEIDYINGYIVRRGEEMGIQAVINYAIMQTVIGKAQMTQREMQEDVPVEKGGPRRWD